MRKYIDADNILYKDLSEGRGVCWVTFRDWIKEMPAADVRENVRGEWQKEYLVEDLGIMLYVCDKCAEPTVKKTNFCPNCGADMRHRS